MVMLDGYHRQYGLQSAYLLPVNLYGPFGNRDFTEPRDPGGADREVRHGDR